MSGLKTKAIGARKAPYIMSNSNIGKIGSFDAPTRPEDSPEKKGRGRPKGSVNAKMPLTLTEDLKQIVSANGRFVWNKDAAQWQLNGKVVAYGIQTIKDVYSEVETIEKLPPLYKDTLGKYVALIFGEIVNKAEMKEAEEILTPLFCSFEAYQSWLIAKTGEVNPHVEKPVTVEDKAQAKAALLAKLRK